MRHKDANWNLGGKSEGTAVDWQQVTIAVLMDIRDEIKQLNRVFGCHNCLRIPIILDKIAANTKRPRRKRKPA